MAFLKAIFFFVLVAVALAVAVSMGSHVAQVTQSTQKNNPQYNAVPPIQTVPYLEIKGHRIAVELARAPEKQAQGLGGRGALADNEGMLFVFDAPALRTFWMKNTPVPLDIVWIKKDSSDGGTIIGVEENVDPQTGTAYSELKLYTSSDPVEYVLEVRGGLMHMWGVSRGDPVLIVLK